MAFNPNEHLMKLGSGQNAQEYLQVKWRIAWFRDLCPTGSIETEIIQLDLDREVTAEVMVWSDEHHKKIKVLKTAKGYCVCRAIVKDGNGGIGTGTKSEAAVDFNDFIEKAESGAIGRALATLGYGTQFTGDEFDEKHRIVDSPVDREQATTPTASKPAPTAPKPQASENKPVEQAKDAPIPTVSQLRSLAAKHVGTGAFDAIVGTLKATYPHTDLKVDDAWEEKHCKHAYDLLKKQINEKKQALAKAS